MTTPVTPSPLAEIVSREVRRVVLPQTREATCPPNDVGAHPDRAVPFTQTLLGGRWVPDVCDICARASEARLREAQQAEQLERDRTARLSRLAVPLLYRDVTLSNFELNPPELNEPAGQGGLTATQITRGKIYKLAAGFLEDWPERQSPGAFFPHIVIFRGGTGTGKGHIAWSIAKAVVSAHADSALVAKLSDIVRDIREAWRRGEVGPSEGQRLARYRHADLLIIDEVSRHALFNGEYTQHLYDLVDWRQERLMPTILTTNEEDSELAALLGPALVSRARTWSGVWDFGAADFRADVLAVRRRAARKARKEVTG